MAGVLKSFRSLVFAVTVFPMRSITSLSCMHMLLISEWVLSYQCSLLCQAYVKCTYIWGILSDLRWNLPCVTEVRIRRIEADIYWELLDAGYFLSLLHPVLTTALGGSAWLGFVYSRAQRDSLFTEILAKIKNSFFLFFAAMKLNSLYYKTKCFL